MEGFSHELMHLVTAVLALGLFIVAVSTYTRRRKKRFLFIVFAFFLFAGKEIILMIYWYDLHLVTHFLNLVILALFAGGLAK